MITFFAFIGMIGAIGVWCVARDCGLSFRLSRIVRATLAAVVLAGVLDIVVADLSCSDVEKYSFAWYAGLCFLGEHSS